MEIPFPVRRWSWRERKEEPRIRIEVSLGGGDMVQENLEKAGLLLTSGYTLGNSKHYIQCGLRTRQGNKLKLLEANV